MSDLAFEIEKVAFDSSATPDRGFSVRASYLKPPHQADALIEIFRDGRGIRAFRFPAYKIYNIAAHFRDIVDGELENNLGGYQKAAWNGISGLNLITSSPNSENKDTASERL